MKLTNATCKNAKPTDKAQKIADGGGLYLEVSPSGSKYWRMKYRFNGKEKRLAFGVYPDVSLQDARERRRLAKRMLDEGQDPNEQKKLDKLERQVSYENNFENVAREWHQQRIHTWKPIHAERILKRLEADKQRKSKIIYALLISFQYVRGHNWGHINIAANLFCMYNSILY